MKKSSISIGMVGFGTVGAGVAKILQNNAHLIRRRVGVPVELVRIADLDTTRDRGVRLPAGVLTADLRQVLDDPSIDIVLELIGGYDTAKRLIVEAMAKPIEAVSAGIMIDLVRAAFIVV